MQYDKWLQDFKSEFNELHIEEKGLLKKKLHIQLDTAINVCGDDWPQNDESQFEKIKQLLVDNNIKFSEEENMNGDIHHHAIDVDEQQILECWQKRVA